MIKKTAYSSLLDQRSRYVLVRQPDDHGVPYIIQDVLSGGPVIVDDEDEAVTLLLNRMLKAGVSVVDEFLSPEALIARRRNLCTELGSAGADWPAQSSVAPDGSPSVVPEAGSPSSAPQVSAGIGQTPEGDGGDGKNGQ